jgi:hypothetical protein
LTVLHAPQVGDRGHVRHVRRLFWLAIRVPSSLVAGR